MNFIKEELLEKRHFRWMNEMLKLGSQWMFNKFGPDGCNTIVTVSLIAIFIWILIGATVLSIATFFTNNLITYAILFIVLMVMVSLISIGMMASTDIEKQSE